MQRLCLAGLWFLGPKYQLPSPHCSVPLPKFRRQCGILFNKTKSSKFLEKSVNFRFVLSFTTVTSCKVGKVDVMKRLCIPRPQMKFFVRKKTDNYEFQSLKQLPFCDLSYIWCHLSNLISENILKMTSSSWWASKRQVTSFFLAEHKLQATGWRIVSFLPESSQLTEANRYSLPVCQVCVCVLVCVGGVCAIEARLVSLAVKTNM